MTKIPERLIERRKYVRVRVPIDITYTIPGKDKVFAAVTKDLSADGLRFQTLDPNLQESSTIEIKLKLPDTVNPVHAQGKVIWKRKLSLEDAAPFDVGIDLTTIEEDNKNTFLKFLCDTIYNLSKGGK